MSHDLIQITDEAHQLDYAWLLPEVAAFAVLGVIGGILGACATWINVQVTKWRHHHVEGVQKQGKCMLLSVCMLCARTCMSMCIA